MIDITNETLLPFSKTPSWTEKNLGKRISPATLHRWRLRGCRGVRLATILIGGQRCTSVEALQTFFEATTRAQDGHSATSLNSNVSTENLMMKTFTRGPVTLTLLLVGILLLGTGCTEQEVANKPKADVVYRVLEQAELDYYDEHGTWGDGPLVNGDSEEEGKKWVWLEKKVADDWKEFLEGNGEGPLIVVEIPIKKPLKTYKIQKHSAVAGAEGDMTHIPLGDLGKPKVLKKAEE